MSLVPMCKKVTWYANLYLFRANLPISHKLLSHILTLESNQQEEFKNRSQKFIAWVRCEPQQLEHGPDRFSQLSCGGLVPTQECA